MFLRAWFNWISLAMKKVDSWCSALPSQASKLWQAVTLVGQVLFVICPLHQGSPILGLQPSTGPRPVQNRTAEVVGRVHTVSLVQIVGEHVKLRLCRSFNSACMCLSVRPSVCPSYRIHSCYIQHQSTFWLSILKPYGWYSSVSNLRVNNNRYLHSEQGYKTTVDDLIRDSVPASRPFIWHHI